jgi:hypothetical protein
MIRDIEIKVLKICYVSMFLFFLLIFVKDKIP